MDWIVFIRINIKVRFTSRFPFVSYFQKVSQLNEQKKMRNKLFRTPWKSSSLWRIAFFFSSNSFCSKRIFIGRLVLHLVRIRFRGSKVIRLQFSKFHEWRIALFPRRNIKYYSRRCVTLMLLGVLEFCHCWWNFVHFGYIVSLFCRIKYYLGKKKTSRGFQWRSRDAGRHKN